MGHFSVAKYKLPQKIRERIEELYQTNSIDFLFCTSTLLEGVNLPAKNIFILSNAKGTTKFGQIDFWNLAGRAGRLTQELSGNIICIRALDKINRWDHPAKDLNIIRDRIIKKVSPIIINGNKNFYKNIKNALIDQPFTRKDASFEQKKIWKHYSNIAFINHMKDEETKLRNTLLKEESDSKEILNFIEQKNKVPEFILVLSSSIKQTYQNNIWTDSNLMNHIFTDKVEYSTCLDNLTTLYEFYNWEEEEAGGLRPLIRNKNTLKYLAMLMNDWINEKPLKLMILNKISYHKKEGYIFKDNQRIPFDGNDKSQINSIINELISDIENKLRFTLRNYFLNFHLICKGKLGELNAGGNWADYLEYGTADPRVIELQLFGLDRKTSKYLIENYSETLVFKNNILERIDKEQLSKISEKDNDIDSVELNKLLSQV